MDSFIYLSQGFPKESFLLSQLYRRGNGDTEAGSNLLLVPQLGCIPRKHHSCKLNHQGQTRPQPGSQGFSEICLLTLATTQDPDSSELMFHPKGNVITFLMALLP